MAKRSREIQAEGTAAIDAAPHKKRKSAAISEAPNDETVNGEVNGVVKHKKSKKPNGTSLQSVKGPGTKGDDTTSGVEEQNADFSKRSKEERRARKAAKRAAKEGTSAAHSDETSAGAIQEESVQQAGALPPVQSKAERKAAKAAKRSVEKPHTNGHATEAKALVGVSQPASSDGYVESSELSSRPQSDIDAYLEEHKVHVDAEQPLRPILSFSHLPGKLSVNTSVFTGFASPTPIQAVSWPYLLAGRDTIGVAQTGSGKTIAFGVPCLRCVSSWIGQGKSKRVPAKAVVVSPTRELAQQIHEQFAKLAEGTEVKVVCVFGGVPKDGQRAALKKAHVIIATPGRLMDFIEEGAADLSQVGYLVLDEADRMLEKGFEQDMRKIISATPGGGRQTLMFTATWPPAVREIAANFMQRPVKITIGDNVDGELRANTKIKQSVEVMDPRDKERRLVALLKEHQSGGKKNDRILVFCLYKKEATRVEGMLHAKGFAVGGIHGDLNMTQRTKSLDDFKKGKVPVLVATDVAARGLDIPAVKVVVNVTFPLTVEDYVHRIGRTGRAGADGLSVTFFTDHDKAHSGELINVLKAAKQPVPEALMKYGTTVKKKSHDMYGAFYKDTSDMKQATKITFD